jgi:hypothetical protein
MTKRLKLFLIAAGMFVAAGLSLAQDPPAQPDEPPVRLKKKNKPDAPKPDPDKPPMKEDKNDPPKKEDPKPDEQPPPPAHEDEAEVLQRIVKNAQLAKEKLDNKELTEGTRQIQDDIIKDLDSLIRGAESPPPQGGGGGEENQPNQGNDSKQGGMGKQSGQQGNNSARAQRAQRRTGSQQANKGGTGSQQAKNDMTPANPMGPSDSGGMGGGAKPPDGGPDKTADLYKDVWGHLPEALRAEMMAYSNDKQFMAKYDDLIKKYYRSIAEQGRRKGD